MTRTGLRRAAIGLCRLALEGNLELEVAALGAARTSCSSTQGAEREGATARDVAEFVEERLEGMLDVPVEFVHAPRARAASTELGAVARLAEALCSGRRQRRSSSSAYVALRPREPAGGGKSDGAAAELDPRLATDEAPSSR